MGDSIFENPLANVTVIHNDVFEHVMPSLSADGWKVLCVALWRTQTERAPVSLDVEQFAQLTGIADRRSVERAIQECVDADCLVSHKGVQPSFALNPGFEPRETVESMDLSPEQEQMLLALLEFGQTMKADADPGQARLAVARNTPNAVRAWIETGRAMTHLKTPERYKTAVARLLNQVPPLPIDILASEEEPVVAAEARGAAELWQAVLNELRPRTKRSLFQWLNPTQGTELANGVFTVAAPNKRTQEWLESGQLADEIRAAVETVIGEAVELVFVVGN